MATETNNVVATKQRQDTDKPTPIGLGISTLKPKFPQYALVSKRRESFLEASTPWPENSPVSLDDLVEAGLVYTGVGDSVRCYHCGGGLRNWEEGDDPMEEHAKWYPTCQHILIAKGKKYIQQVEAGENPEKDSATPQINVQPREDPLSKDKIILQTLNEFGYSDSEAMIAIGIYRKRHGPCAKFSSTDIASILMELEDNPSLMNQYKDTVTDVPTSIQQPRPEDAADDIAILEEENQSLKEKQMCKICLDQRADVIFLPCGHMVSCPMCAPALNKCPICRKSVMGLVKAFFATKTEQRDNDYE